MPLGGNTKIKNVLGPQIRRRRYQMGWSQSQLAIKLQLAGLDIDRNGIKKIEGQLARIKDIEILYLRRVLQLPCDQLFPPDDPKKPIDQIVRRLLFRIIISSLPYAAAVENASSFFSCSFS
jgi:transcriptional regulator with XRE-family HTH domain